MAPGKQKRRPLLPKEELPAPPPDESAEPAATAPSILSGAAAGRVGFFLGLTLLLILATVGAWLAWSLTHLNNPVITDAPGVTACARQIADMDLPAGLPPDRAFELHMPLRRRPALTWARFADQAGPISLVVAQSDDPFNPQLNAALMRTSIEQSLNQRGIKTKHVLPEANWLHEVTIRGQAVHFTCLLGPDPKTHTPALEVMGLFPGKAAAAMLFIYADLNNCTRDEVLKIVDSIR